MRGSGDGLLPAPTKPVTPGRVADHVPAVVVEVAPDQQVARGTSSSGRRPSCRCLISTTSSSGMTTSWIRSSMFMERVRASRFWLDLVLVARLGVEHVPLAGTVVGALDLRAPRRGRSSSSMDLAGVGVDAGCSRRARPSSAGGRRPAASSATASASRRVGGASGASAAAPSAPGPRSSAGVVDGSWGFVQAHGGSLGDVVAAGRHWLTIQRIDLLKTQSRPTMSAVSTMIAMNTMIE